MDHIHHEHSSCEETTPSLDHRADHTPEEAKPDSDCEACEDDPQNAA